MRSLLAVLCLGLSIVTARAEMACAPVPQLRDYLSKSGKVVEITGADSAYAYAETFGELPEDATIIGVLIYDAGGVAIGAGMIEDRGQGPCVRYSIAISRDKHLAALDAMRGI